jgi:8-oxo-dGTP diphosphatase
MEVNMAIPLHIVAVGALVVNEDGCVLLVKSPRRGWEFPGGQVEVGESLPQALVREIKEESGVAVQVDDLVGIYSNTSTVGRDGQSRPPIVNIDFLCTYTGGNLTCSDESIEVGWFTKSEALKRVTFPILKERLANMLAFDGSVHCSAFDSSLRFIEEHTLAGWKKRG